GPPVIHAAPGELTAAAEKAFAVVETAKTNAAHLADVATQHAGEVTAAVQHAGELIKQIQAMEQNIAHGVSEVHDLEQKWVQLGETTAQGIGEALHQTTAELDQKF